MAVFVMDGISYDVHVTALIRKFAVLDTEETGRTQDGNMYRDPVGTFYNYTMTVCRKAGNSADLDAFWEAISQPVESHICTFPYGQQTLTQRMYVTAGEQAVQRLTDRGAYWGEITVNFIAMQPQVRL